jgi:PKD repeat protein
MMKKYVCLVSLCAALIAPAVAFADAETVNFESLMDTASAFIYGGDHVYEFLDGNGYDEFAHGATNHKWVPPCDNNGNGIPDVIEFAVLSAIFADTGNPLHAELHEAYKANVTRAHTDLGSLAAALTAPTYFLRQIMAAYVLLGDGSYQSMVISGVRYGWGFTGSWGTFAETIGGMATYGSGWNTGAPAEANYQKKASLVGPCGNADSDAVINIGEFYGQGGVHNVPDGDAQAVPPTDNLDLNMAVRAAYVAAVLATGTAVDGGDPAGVCEEGPGPGALAWGSGLWWNPTTKYVYTAGPSMPYAPGRYWAQNSFTVGDPPVPVVGELASIPSADLNAWFVANILAFVNDTMIFGGADETVGSCTTTEGHWKWMDSCTEFWSGVGSGLTPPGGPVGGAFTNWNGGTVEFPQSTQLKTTEPNNSGGENILEVNTAGGWNDNGTDDAQPICVEFTNGGAGYEDLDSNGYPDWWEQYVPAPGPGTNPTAAFSGAPLSGMQPLEVTFTDASVPAEGDTITGWAWTFGDGGTSTDQDPVHVYADPGTFDVSLTVTTAAEASDIETKTGYISVEERQYRGTIESTNALGWYEEGDPLVLSADVVGAVGDLSYQWQKNGEDITGATDATYDFGGSLTSDNSGSYTCVVNDESKAELILGPFVISVFPAGSLPVAGIVGLGLLLGASVFGARFVLKKK